MAENEDFLFGFLDKDLSGMQSCLEKDPPSSIFIINAG
jgi:hypothetical protein